MKATKCCGIVTFILMAGCCATFNRSYSDSSYGAPSLFPTFVFSGENAAIHGGRRSIAWYEWEGVLIEELGRDEVEKMKLDPFWSQTFWNVDFHAFTPPPEILHYYESVFDEQGWHLKREHLAIEEKKYGKGVIVRVLQKDDALIRFMVSWPPEEPEDNFTKSAMRWTVSFSFIGIEPKDFFGRKYRLKGMRERFSDGYHVVLPNSNRAIMLRRQEYR